MALTNGKKRLYDATDAALSALYGHESATAGEVIPILCGTDGRLSVTVSEGTLTSKHGLTLTSSTGSLNATTGTLVAAGSNRTKVYAFSFTTTSTTSSILTLVDGAYGGTTLWRAVLLAPSGGMAGANLVVPPPAFICRTTTATLLRLNCDTAVPIEWAVSYFDEA